MSKWELMGAFADRKLITLKENRSCDPGITGIIEAIKHDDATGRNFNVLIGNQWYYVRCNT